jgi:DNA-binding NtrC family response regulator
MLAPMKSLETTPEPATSPTARADLPAIMPSVNSVRLLCSCEMRARILYVDDEPQLRRLGELVLVPAGYEVDTAADGAEAWTALHDHEYHLVITDNDMPRLTGLKLAAQARLAGMRIPIVLASGSADVLGDPANSWLGLAARLSKPFNADALLETVEQVLRVTNNTRECSSAMMSVFARMARIQPFPHGGINE